MRITISDVARELRAVFPYMTDDMLRQDAESGFLPTYPRHKETAWYWVNPALLPEYVRRKTAGVASEDDVEKILGRLKGYNAQCRLPISA